MPVSHFIANSTSTFGHFKDKMNVLIDTFNGLNVPAGTLVTTTGPQTVTDKTFANTIINTSTINSPAINSAIITNGSSSNTAVVSPNLIGVRGLSFVNTPAATSARDNLNAQEKNTKLTSISALAISPGDVLVGNSSNTFSKLTKGANNTILSVSSGGSVVWQAPASSVISINGSSGVLTGFATDDSVSIAARRAANKYKLL